MTRRGLEYADFLRFFYFWPHLHGLSHHLWQAIAFFTGHIRISFSTRLGAGELAGFAGVGGDLPGLMVVYQTLQVGDGQEAGIQIAFGGPIT